MADITRETIEALGEKIDTFAASLTTEERAVFLTTLGPAEGEDDVEGYGSFGTPLNRRLARSIGLRPGRSIRARKVYEQADFIKLKSVIHGSKD